MPNLSKAAVKGSTRPASSVATSTSASAIPINLFDSVTAWESWLAVNHENTAGIWLQISKKGVTPVTVTYDEALDSALCYGWIDGQRKAHSDTHFIQKFTPRRPRSLWSRRNVEKVGVLTTAGRMQAAGLAEMEAARADGRWERAYAGSSTIGVPAAFEEALDRNKKAKEFFGTLNKTQRYSFLWRIETAKKPETRRRHIERSVGMLAEGKTIHRT